MTNRRLPRDAEVWLARGDPIITGGGTIKALSAQFLADLQSHWLIHRTEILDKVAKTYPQQYFAGMVTLARVIRWEVGAAGEFDRQRSPEEIIDQLERKVGAQGRAIFEEFLAKVAQLQEQQRLEITGEVEEEEDESEFATNGDK